MEDKLGDLITALTELVEKLDDKSTGEVTSKARFNPDDMFAPTEDQVSAKENKELAKDIAKENAKNNKEKKTSRKILKDVMPVSVVNFDSKALKQLGDVVSSNITDRVAKDTEAPKDKVPSWLKTLKMIGYGAFAIIIGPIIALFAFFEEIGKQKWFISLKDFLKTKVGGKLAKLFKPITSFFDKFRNRIGNLWKSIKKFFKPVTDTLKSIGTKIKNIGNSIKSLLSPIFGGATKPGLFTRLMNIILKNPVIKGMTAFFKGLGSMLGKIFLPITIIMGVFDFVTGFMDGYEKEGSIIDGIEGGITKVFDTLIAMPLDMLKSAVSWILGKFGFTEAEKTLDAFSFSKLLSDMIGGLFQTYKDIFAKITSVLTGIWDSFIGIFTSTGEADEKGMVEKALVFVYKILTLPFDLIKDTVSWLLGAFGFENAEKSLDSWSFAKIYEDLIGAVFGFMDGAFEFVKSLFTEPKKAFEKIGKWFDKLFADPIGTIKALLPTWMTDFGTWVWDTLIAPVAKLFTSTASNPVAAKAAFKKLLPKWMSGFGDWVFDTYILPISQYFDKLLNSTSASEILSALIPQWLKDTGKWVYDNTIQPLMDIFSDITKDPKGSKSAFLEMLPDWMTGIGGWVFDEVIAPIAKWFTDFDDPSKGFIQILKENAPWVLDMGGWIADKFSLLWEEIANIFEPIVNFDFTSLIPDSVKSIIPGLGATKKQKKQNEDWQKIQGNKKKTVETVKSSSLMMALPENVLNQIAGDQGAAMNGMLNPRAMEKTNQLIVAAADSERGGINIGGTKVTLKSLSAMKDDDRAKISEQYKQMISQAEKSDNNMMKRTAAQLHKSKLGQSLLNNKSTPGGADGIVKTSEATIKKGTALHDRLMKLRELQIKHGAKDFFGLYKADRDAAKSLQRAFATTGSSSSLGIAISKINLRMRETNQMLLKSQAVPEMNDFIWRPGQKPMTFSKGDILIGSHEDNISPTTAGKTDSSGKDMINRMDKMVELMTEHSGIHTKVLEVLTESGLIDKQGNTVVNNGGNSTTVNNSVAEPSIMDFRDRVVGRLSK